MTSPPERITVQCPACGATFKDWHRPSINRDLDEYIDEATSAICPTCGHIVKLAALVVCTATPER